MLKKSIVLLIAFLMTMMVVLLDQTTKFWALSHLEPLHSHALSAYFSWTLLFNTGAAFSFLSGAGGWQHLFFVGLTSVMILVFLIAMIRNPQETNLDVYQTIALGFLLGGAIGNLIDRLRIGMVVDFIDVHYQQYHWPVFNIADAAICLGGMGLLWVWYRAQK